MIYNDVVLPEANHRLKTLTADIHKMRPTIAIREGVFMDDFEGYMLLVQKVDHDRNVVRDVTAYALDPEEPVRTIHAPWGRAPSGKMHGDRLVIRLHDGEMHEVDPDEPDSYFLLHFAVHNLVFDNLGTRLTRREASSRGDRELPTGRMRALVREIRGESAAVADSSRTTWRRRPSTSRTAVRASAAPGAELRPADFSSRARVLLRKIRSGEHHMERQALDVNRYEVEIHKKWAFPTACFVFAALARRWARGSAGEPRSRRGPRLPLLPRLLHGLRSEARSSGIAATFRPRWACGPSTWCWARPGSSSCSDATAESASSRTRP